MHVYVIDIHMVSMGMKLLQFERVLYFTGGTEFLDGTEFFFLYFLCEFVIMASKDMEIFLFWQRLSHGVPVIC